MPSNTTHLSTSTTCVTGLLWAVLCLIPHAALPAAEDRIDPEAEAPIWRFEFDNDFFFGDDNQLSAGWSLQRHSPAAGSWESVQAPRWMTRLGERIPSLDPADHVHRIGIGIGQMIQTPNDLSRSDFIPDDVPYVATLGIFVSWTAVSPDHVAGLQAYLGTTGKPALGEEIQTTAHDLIDNEEPSGWDNQLAFEPLINLNYARGWKLASAGGATGPGVDLSAGGFAAVGNLSTTIDVMFQSRIGWNLPPGFSSIPDPGGIGVSQIARVGRPERTAIFLTVGARACAVGYTIFLDGSLFDSAQPEAPERDVMTYQAVLGAHVVTDGFAVHAHYVFSTDPVDVPGTDRSWAAITLEWSL